MESKDKRGNAKNVLKLCAAALVFCAAAAMVYFKGGDKTPESNAATQPAQTASLPAMIELGSEKCVPCKMMQPIIDELKRDYAGSLHVEFHDVWQDRQAAEKYSVRAIPTQVFLNPQGEEIFRHEGFFPKEDILSKWKELGFELKKTPQ